MGFLDNSTANIIVDAVLTDLGRQLLAANDGSFSIRRFSLADDEVDYGVVTRFGLVVGKEKIETSASGHASRLPGPRPLPGAGRGQRGGDVLRGRFSARGAVGASIVVEATRLLSHCC